MPAVSFFSRVQMYARRIVGGEEVAGQFERLACERFLRDLDRQNTDEFPYVIDEAAGSRACEFQELLPHIKGDWAQPVWINGEAIYPTIKLEDWQVFVEFQLFGWVHRTTKKRRFRRSYEEIARKNAKSTRAAGRLLYLLVADGEPGAQCYNAATTGKQAREVFDVARNMALRARGFVERFGVMVGMHSLSVDETASALEPLNAEGSTLDGLNVHGGVADEVHAHKKRDLWDVLDTATGARSQPMLSAITTAGSNRAGICYELRKKTIMVLQGVMVDETWFGIIYTIDDGDDWRDPKVWRKGNPNLGVSVYLDDLEAACRSAIHIPSAQANFLTKRLNVWVSSDSAWMDMQAWDRCGDPTLTVERVKHLPCWRPLDLASKVDVAAAPYLFYDEEKDHYFLISRFWLPERAIQIGANSQYDGWRRSEHLKVTDGEVIDFDLIEDDLRGDMSAFEMQEFPYDPWQATQLATRLLGEGAPMVEYRQTVQNMSEPMKTLEAIVLQGKLTHDANPMMTWMMSNVVCHVDAKDNIYPRKERDENKIDGPVATIMGIGRIIAGRENNAIEQGFVQL